ncbi:MAG: xanthine dehydrogenase family protein molybdopterin-binding subunit, partial [Actinomycetota bacterium]
GRSRFVADIRLPGMVEMALVRSQFAHANVRVNLEPARSAEGVLAVVAAEDLSDVSPFPDFITYMQPVKSLPLALGKVRYVGAPIAAIVAEDRYLAEDVAELVEVDYEALPAVASMEAALAEDAPNLYDDWPDNRIVNLPLSLPDVEEVFANHRVVKGRYSTHRHSGVPMETRGCVAEHRDGRLTLYTGAQSPHITRTTLSYVLPIAERDIHVVVPDVGGGFGVKTHIYPEEVLVCWLAMRLGRPVRWIEDRTEHLVASNHAREQTLEIEAAIDEEGVIQAVRCHVLHDVGSGEIFMPGICASFVTGGQVAGAYRVRLAQNSYTQVVTNKTPSGAYRGFGAPEAYFAVERLVEKIAKEVGVDSIELRRKMLLDDQDLPWTSATGGIIDSGSFREAFERALELGREAEARRRAEYADDDRVRIGLGVATYVEGTTPTYFGTTGHWTSHDSATIRVDPDGGVTVSVGVTTTGQGTTTMAAVLAADALGVPLDSVRVEMGDTDHCPYGLGGWGSRSTVAGGGAILRAAGSIRDKVFRIAAHLLETDEADLEIEQGEIRVKGIPDKAVTMADVGTAAWVRTLDLPPEVDPGLEVTAVFDPPLLQHVPDDRGRMNGAATWANATHTAVVKVDVETGLTEILDYVAVHDCGPMVNPPIVEGQVHGGVAQEIGGVLYEHLAYSEDGQPLATTFVDYLIPTATEIPDMVVEHFESPSPNMPLGMKGAGEGGTLGPPAAISNAVVDALEEFGVEIDALPITPAVLRSKIRSAGERRPPA